MTSCQEISGNGRYFLNALPDVPRAAFPGAPASSEATTETLKKNMVATIMSQAQRIEQAVPPGSSASLADASLYTGAAGLALCFHLLANGQEAMERVTSVHDPSSFDHFRDLSRRYSEDALASSRDLCRRHLQKKPDHVVTLFTGAAGACAVQAVIGCHGPSPSMARIDPAISDTLNTMHAICVDPALPSDELLYGRAGYLHALLFTARHVAVGETAVAAAPAAQAGEGGVVDAAASGAGEADPPPFDQESLQRVLRAIVLSGLKGGNPASCPLMYSWHGKEYLGAAHGLMGILFTLLHFPSAFGDRVLQNGGWTVGELIRSSIDYLCSLMTRRGGMPAKVGSSDELVHWCHGSTGMVFLLCKAYQVLGDAKYLSLAQRAGEDVWTRGLLTKPGRSLCHGIAGNGYALLALYKATKQEMYLYRAMQFARVCLEHEELWQSDSPFSLYEGMAGLTCFYLSLLTPQSALFPGFEVPEAQATPQE
eukprot:jgi/Mesvir1/23873/Mv10668-RA.1